MSEVRTLAIDAMGGDAGVETIVEGVARAVAAGAASRFLFVGRENETRPLLEARPALAALSDVVDAPDVVAMDDKPAGVLRRGRETSMWKAVAAVASGEAGGVVSSGNTGALMAVGRMQLKMIEGVDRPAISALWPTPRGRIAVLDVGANVEVSAHQLVQFAIMGEAFVRGLKGLKKPSVGLLNVGSEDVKGNDLIREAARILVESDPEMNFHGFVEGNDISAGTVDVVVTDGFTGNIALKTAEGTARLVGGWVREALTSSLTAKLAALVLKPSLKPLRDKLNPSSVNGGVFLGLGGLVVKSHGGADADGVRAAVIMTETLMASDFRGEIAATVARVAERDQARDVADAPLAEAAAS
ncbi:MAG: phosphate acyltransferase PlsX [Pseudomonadota bacterium]